MLAQELIFAEMQIENYKHTCLNNYVPKRCMIDLPDYLTEIMKKYGPKETTYAMELEDQDNTLLGNFFSAMTTQENPPQFIEYFDALERKYNDHKNVFVQVGNQKVYFGRTTRTEDLATIQGLAIAIRVMFQDTSALPRYFAVGSDSREPRAYHNQLFAEVTPRMDTSNGAEGSRARINESMKWVGLFPAAHGTVTAVESGISNTTDNNGTYTNRNTFTDDPIPHVSGVLAFNLATMISLAGVLTWI